MDESKEYFEIVLDDITTSDINKKAMEKKEDEEEERELNNVDLEEGIETQSNYQNGFDTFVPYDEYKEARLNEIQRK